MRYRIIIGLLVFLPLLTDSHAEVRLGVGQAMTHDSDWVAQDVMLSDRDWYAQITRFGGDARLPDTWRYSAGYRIDWRERDSVALFMRFGIAYFEDSPAYVVSERYTFDLAAGVRLFSFIDIEWQHNSTAGRSKVNLGNDVLLVSLVFR